MLAKESWAFLQSVFHHWVWFVSSSLLMVGLGLGERYMGTDVSWSAYSLILLLGVVAAVWRAWLEEYRKTALEIRMSVVENRFKGSESGKAYYLVTLDVVFIAAR